MTMILDFGHYFWIVAPYPPKGELGSANIRNSSFYIAFLGYKIDLKRSILMDFLNQDFVQFQIPDM